ncbi:hypothetical protein [Methylobacterium sp. Leaf118]|uniref:hypothetical protein n=1 Tax=Methylobacterium sp. Leaf118 TaxID=2876562 RepID=UPI001E537902|nr:hypothetical protein [Methylobacterium sp. Leaf118]
MAEAETVQVQPLTTYYEGSEHKSAVSEPYAVPRWHAQELAAQGFAKLVEGEAEPQGKEARPDAADEGPVEEDARPRGRRGTLKI